MTYIEKVKRKHIDELHFEHRLWTSAVRFYTDELAIYQQRLEEMVGKNSDPETRKKINHFQNQFIIQKEQLYTLKHHIGIYGQRLSKYAEQHPVAIDHILSADHKEMEDKYEIFRTFYNKLKAEFIHFMRTRL